MNTISAINLDISIQDECPLCESLFDLFEIESLTDDGKIYKLVLNPEGFGGENLNIKFNCPTCRNEITVKDIVW